MGTLFPAMHSTPAAPDASIVSRDGRRALSIHPRAERLDAAALDGVLQSQHGLLDGPRRDRRRLARVRVAAIPSRVRAPRFKPY